MIRYNDPPITEAPIYTRQALLDAGLPLAEPPGLALLSCHMSEAEDREAAIVSERLREARIAAGVTQAELAAEAGVSPSVISHYERQICTVSIRRARALAGVLGIRVDELVETPADLAAD